MEKKSYNFPVPVPKGLIAYWSITEDSII